MLKVYTLTNQMIKKYLWWGVLLDRYFLPVDIFRWARNQQNYLVKYFYDY